MTDGPDHILSAFHSELRTLAESSWTTPRFIVFEGIDGSGTTTQVKLVAQLLRDRGHRVHETREPSAGPIGKLTRELLAVGQGQPVDASALALLFAADRLEHLQREVEPALADGQIVLCDRYVVSSWVYQSLDCDRAWVEAINRRARWPDMTFILDLPAEVAMARVDARRAQTQEAVERFDALESQLRLAAGYAAVLDESRPGVVRIDADPSVKSSWGILDVDPSIEAVSWEILAQLERRGL